MQSVDCRSQYYPSSNVQPSNLSDDLFDDSPPPSEPVDSLDVDGSFAERHSPETPQAVGRMSSPNLTRASRGHETTPLLRKAASFTVFSTNSTPAPATRTDPKFLSHAGGHPEPQNSAPIPSTGTAEHHYKGKSTYGQTVSLKVAFPNIFTLVISYLIAPRCFWVLACYLSRLRLHTLDGFGVQCLSSFLASSLVTRELFRAFCESFSSRV